MIPESLPPVIRRFEGLRLKPYRCPAGVPTIGYGHTGPEVRMDSPPITKAMAELWLIEDATKACRSALLLSPTLAGYSDRLAAIADFIFNLGAGRYKASTLRRRVASQDWDDAAHELRKWVWGGGKKLPGLVLRREVNATLILSDIRTIRLVEPSGNNALQGDITQRYSTKRAA